MNKSRLSAAARVLCLVLSAMLAVSLCACSRRRAKKSTSDDPISLVEGEKKHDANLAKRDPATHTADPGSRKKTTGASESGEANTLTLKAGDCLAPEGYGFIVDEGSEIEVTLSDSGKQCTWQIFTMAEKPADVTQLPSSGEPVLTGEGKFTAVQGGYVFVFCTADSPAADASVTFAGNGLPKD